MKIEFSQRGQFVKDNFKVLVWTLFFLWLITSAVNADVSVDIRANGLDTPHPVSEQEIFTLSVSQNLSDEADSYGDYWLVVNTPSGLYHYDLSSGWQPGVEATYQGKLLSFPLTVIMSSSMSELGMPQGGYTFYFGTDKNMDAEINGDSLVYDQVMLNVNNNGNIILGSSQKYPFDTNLYMLFAHGMGDTKDAWDNFASYSEVRGFNVERFNVSRCGSIEERASALADNITQNVSQDVKMKTVGHSMGGLDLRKIVGEAHKGHEPYHSAARRFLKVYTIGTPHGGQFFADKLNIGVCDTTSGARQDLSDSSMDTFNQNYPYSEFSVDSIPMPFLAFPFQCWNLDCGFGTTDCVVGTSNQSWAGAPHYGTLSGKHSNDLANGIGAACTAELDNTEEVMAPIINDPDCGYSEPKTNVQIRISLPFSNKCLDVAGIKSDSGANIQQYSCGTNLPNQEFWVIPADSSDYYQLKAAHSGKCLDVKSAGQDNGTNVQQSDCANVDNQKFRFESFGDGTYRIRAKHSNKCLDNSGSFSNGGNIQQWHCVSADSPYVGHQKFRLHEESRRFVKIVSKRTGKVMEVAGNSVDNGANIQQWEGEDVINQWFILARMNDNSNNPYYRIISQGTGKCFDVAGGSQDNKANIQQYDCADVANQKFTLESKGNGYYQIKAEHSHKCLDLEGGSSANGANIQQYECVDGEPNQLWKIETE